MSACSETTTIPPAGRAVIAVSLDVTAGTADRRLAVHVVEVAGGAATRTLLGDTLDITTGPQRLPLSVDIARCGTTRGTCTLGASLSLLSANGQALDSVFVGPITVRYGTPATLPAAVLREVDAVSISVPSSIVAVGAATQLTVDAKDKLGASLGGKAVTFSVTPPTAASVSSSGVLTARTTGRLIVTATVGGRTAAATLDAYGVTNPNCRAPLIPKSGRVTTSETWPRAPGSYLVTATFEAGNGAVVTIERGNTVCLLPNVNLQFVGGRIIARGTAAERIRFTAADTTKRWGAMLFGGTVTDSSHVTNAILEWGGWGQLDPTTSFNRTSPFAFDSVTMRQWSGAAFAGAAFRLSRSVIDTVVDSRYAVGLDVGSVLEETTIRGADSVAVIVMRSGVTIKGGAIEGSGTNGLRIWNGVATIAGTLPIIRGSRGYPVQATLQGLAALRADSLVQSRWLGNGRDTILVDNGGVTSAQTLTRDTVTAYGHLPWRVNASFTANQQSLIRLRPGAVLAFAGGNTTLVFASGARLDARGTNQHPVRIAGADAARPWGGLTFRDAAPDSSFLRNTILEGAGDPSSAYAVTLTGTHALAIDSTRMRSLRNGAINAQTPAGLRIERSMFENITNSGGQRTLWLFAGDILRNIVINNVRGTAFEVGKGIIDSISISQVTGDGFVSGNTVTASHVSLSGISGRGVVAVPLAGSQITLANSWYGAVAGPNSTGAVTVAGNVIIAGLSPIPIVVPVVAPQ